MTFVLDSLRYRFFMALGVVLLLALAALGLIAKQLVIPALVAKEDEFASAELDRALCAINNEQEHLSLLNKDWATWDDSYFFMQDLDNGYRDTNLADALVFEDANLRMMAFLHLDGSPYWIAGLEPDEDRYEACATPQGDCRWSAPIIDSLQARIASGQALNQHAWLLAAPERALVSMWPIVHSTGEGPAIGWLAMVRLMNDDWFARLEESTGLKLAIKATDTAQAPSSTRIERLDSHAMVATRTIAASPQGYSLKLQANLPRQRFKASLETFRFALYWTIGLLVVVIAVVLFLLERMILAPLRQFARFTQQLQAGDDSGPPASLLHRRDEIGILAREFSHLLVLQRHQTSTLVELSQHDPLTGLANRRLFDAHLASALASAGPDQPVALLMIDIDHFKSYNDHYGHPAGDDCLRLIAEAMRHHFSTPQQLVARTGGEEFTVVLPTTACDAGEAQAHSLRLAIEALALPHPASSVGPVVTVSIGVACSASGHAHGADSLIAAADSALYRAKLSGRNRVDVAEPSVLT